MMNDPLLSTTFVGPDSIDESRLDLLDLDALEDLFNNSMDNNGARSPSQQSDSGVSSDGPGSPQSIVDEIESYSTVDFGDLLTYENSESEVPLHTAFQGAQQNRSCNVQPAAQQCPPASQAQSNISSNKKSIQKFAVTTPASTNNARVAKVVRTAKKNNVPVESEEELRKKNAQQAKINREKKKQYIQGLEQEASSLRTENEKLKREAEERDNIQKSLEEEVLYLKSVIANQSALSGLLRNMDNIKGVTLSTSFASGRKRTNDIAQSNQKQCKKSRGNKPLPQQSHTGGICLHVVDNERVSMEFCSTCSRMSNGASRHGGDV